MPLLTRLEDLTLRPAIIGSWRLVTTVVYAGQEDTFTVPVGFVTDLATIPSVLRSPTGLDPYGPYVLAAIVHDYLLHLLAKESAPPVTSRDADGIFRRIMREEGVDLWTRWTMWAAVRVGALFNPRRAYGRAFLRDLPMVLLVAAPALLLAPAALLNMVTRAALKPLRMLH